MIVAVYEHVVDLCLDKSVTSNLAAYYEGSYLAQLKQRLSAHAAERVTFAGLVPHSEIASYYAAADICVCPSLYESFGMSVIEAMAAGVPVVATRVGAVPQLISDQHTGLIVNTADPKAIASAIARLFGNAQLWSSISRSARKQVSEQYSWDTICTRLHELYSGLLCSDSRILDRHARGVHGA